LNSLKK